MDSSWLDSNWPAGSNRCNQVLLAWKMLYMTLLCITSCQGTYFDSQTCDLIRQRHTLWPNRSLMLSIPYKIIVGLHRILVQGQLEAWRQTTGRTCFWRTRCNLHCRSKSMPKSRWCEAAHIGQWHIPLLAFNILIKYDYRQVTRQWLMPRHVGHEPVRNMQSICF